jgi:hypothetical protein
MVWPVKYYLFSTCPLFAYSSVPHSCSVISTHVEDDEIQYLVALETYTIDCPMLAWPEGQLLVPITVLKHGSNASKVLKLKNVATDKHV